MAARRTTVSLVFLGLVALAMFALAAPAHAAFPGANGKINFVRNPGGGYFMNPDGSAQTPTSVWGIWSPDAGHMLRSCNKAVCVFRADGTFEQENYYAAAVHGMGWSPDGTKIVHAEMSCFASYCDPDRIVYEGYPSGPGAEVTAQDDLEPAWSPNGTRIAFVTFRHDPRDLFFDGPPGPPGSTELQVSNVDGTGQLRLTNSPGDEGGPTGGPEIDDNDGESLPSWSPDGKKIAVASNRDGNWEIYVVNADGSGSQRLTNNPATDLRPRWSPDGTKIAFQTNRDGNQEIYSMNPDGSGQTNLTRNSADDILYDWLTAPSSGYPRPRGATPFKTYLVPAYKQCTAPNTSHGAPLFYGSCGPPVQASNFLTIGTPDANGAAANSTGFIFLRVKATSPSDVLISGTITDVRCRPATASAVCNGANNVDGPDYSGELQGNATIRVTDHYNGPGLNEPATVQDIQFPINMTCANTADTTRGGVCTVNTSGPVVCPECGLKEGQRTVVQLAQYQVFDGGSDGQVSTTTDNTLFEVQGIFIP